MLLAKQKIIGFGQEGRYKCAVRSLTSALLTMTFSDVFHDPSKLIFLILLFGFIVPGVSGEW